MSRIIIETDRSLTLSRIDELTNEIDDITGIIDRMRRTRYYDDDWTDYYWKVQWISEYDTRRFQLEMEVLELRLQVSRIEKVLRTMGWTPLVLE